MYMTPRRFVVAKYQSGFYDKNTAVQSVYYFREKTRHSQSKNPDS